MEKLYEGDYWFNGSFEGKMKDVVWFDGIFEDGYAEQVDFHNVIFKKGDLLYSNVKGGRIENCRSMGSSFRNTIIKDIRSKEDGFLDSTIEGGSFENVSFVGVKLLGGVVSKGSFRSGEWLGGFWNSGIWGTYFESHPIWHRGYILDRSVNKEFEEEYSFHREGSYVYSLGINPFEYFRLKDEYTCKNSKEEKAPSSGSVRLHDAGTNENEVWGTPSSGSVRLHDVGTNENEVWWEGAPLETT